MKRAILCLLSLFCASSAWANTCQITSPLPLPVTLSGCTYSGSLPSDSTSYIQNTLSPSTTTQVYSVQTATVTNSATVSYLTGGRCVETDSTGKLISASAACGSGGGGASTLAVTTGTAAGFTTVASSPTAVLNFDSATFGVSLTGSATGFVTLLPSSVTLLGQGVLTTSSATATYLQSSSATVTYLNVNQGLTAATAASTYLTQSSATATYLQSSSATVTYLNVNQGLTAATAASTYLTQSSATATYLQSSSATATYCNVNGLNCTAGGDATGTTGALVITDDSHNHTSSSISGVDISADTNLAVTYPVVLTNDTLSLNHTLTSSLTVTNASGANVTYGLNIGSVTGAGLATCGDATHALAWSDTDNKFACQEITVPPGSGDNLGSGVGSYGVSTTTGGFSGAVSMASGTVTTYLTAASNDFGNNLILVDPNKTASISTSVGGAVLLENTGNTGAGLVIYSNAGASTGRLMNIRADNASFDQPALHIDHDGTANAFEIAHSGQDASALAFNVTSTNLLDSVFGISGLPSAKGVGKITHSGTGNDSSASVLSLELSGAGTSAQGLFLDATDSGGTKGKLLNIRNAGVEYMVLYSTPDSGHLRGLEVTTMTIKATGELIVLGSATVAGPLGASVNYGLTAATVTVNDDAYAAGWNGSTLVPTKNAVYDKLESSDWVGQTQLTEAMNFVPTGAWDFGGGVLEIPNGSNPTVDATGETAFDTTANQLLVYNGTSVQVIATSTKCVTVNISSGTGYNGVNEPIWSPVNDVTITQIKATSLPIGTTVVYQLDETASAYDTAGTDVFSVAHSSANYTTVTTASFANAGISGGNALVFNCPAAGASAGSPRSVFLRICYTEDRQ